MDEWGSGPPSIPASVTAIVTLALVWWFHPAGRTQFPRQYTARSLLLGAVGGGVLSSVAYGSILYLSGADRVWDATKYGVAVGVMVMVLGLLYRLLYRWLWPPGT